MTPAMDALLPVSSIAAIATPLPVIFPTSITGAATYAKAGQVDRRAAMWMATTGLLGAAVGALATEWVDPALLLLVTAALLGWQSVGIIRGPKRAAIDPASRRARTFPRDLRHDRSGGRGGLRAPGRRRRARHGAAVVGVVPDAAQARAGHVPADDPGHRDPRHDRACPARQHRMVGRGVPRDRRGARGTDRREARPGFRGANPAPHGRVRDARGRRPATRSNRRRRWCAEPRWGLGRARYDAARETRARRARRHAAGGGRGRGGSPCAGAG